jgi:hypothetical protein
LFKKKEKKRRKKEEEKNKTAREVLGAIAVDHGLLRAAPQGEERVLCGRTRRSRKAKKRKKKKKKKRRKNWERSPAGAHERWRLFL